jgi:hypothetical protein
MTRKEQIKAILDEYAIFKGYYVKGGVGAERIYSSEIADRIAALPLDVPGDDEIETKASLHYPLYDPIPKSTTTETRSISGLKRVVFIASAKWMRSEILKRNTL